MRRAGDNRRRGAAMSEMVLTLPLLLLILSLIFYFGRAMVRVQHAEVLSRYETWRQATGAPGPASNEPRGHGQLDAAFFAGNAESLAHDVNDGHFPRDPFDYLTAAAARTTPDVADLAESLLYRPPGDAPRQSHGRREGFVVRHPLSAVRVWQAFDGPVSRRFGRIGHEWPFVHDWRAGPDQWTGGHAPAHQLRALRDVFFKPLDEPLDALDGDGAPEYDGPTEHPVGDVLAGFIRTLYLREPPYRGPIVHDEGP